MALQENPLMYIDVYFRILHAYTIIYSIYLNIGFPITGRSARLEVRLPSARLEGLQRGLGRAFARVGAEVSALLELVRGRAPETIAELDALSGPPENRGLAGKMGVRPYLPGTGTKYQILVPIM